MGSEGYLINQFLAPRTNKRTDQLGRVAPANRRRFAVEIVRRRAGGRRRRTSSSSTGCRWPTSSRTVRPGTRSSRSARTSRPPAPPSSTPASAGTRRACRPSSPRSRARRSPSSPRSSGRTCGIPVVASNRINMPQVAEEVLARGDADLVSMARPLLADPDWVRKAAADADRRDQHLHRLQPGLPRPRVRPQEGVLHGQPAGVPGDRAGARARRAAPSGWPSSAPDRPGSPRPWTAGPRAGTGWTCSRRAGTIGGQFDIAGRIPGKEEFTETIRYYTRQLELTGVTLHLGTTGRGAPT